MAAAAVATINPAGIPGLGLPLEKADMNLARFTYNALPNFEDQARLQSQYANHIKALLNIIGRHSMGDHFRVHSAHRHEVIPDGTVRFEAEMALDVGTKDLTWTRATEPEDPVAGNMHATFFKVVNDTLVAFEFAKGPSPIAGRDIPPDFLGEFVAYLTNHGLTDLMALEVGEFATHRALDMRTAEMEIQWGKEEILTIVMPISLLVAKSIDELIPTGWNVNTGSSGTSPSDPDPEPAPGTHYAQVTNPVNTHRVFVDSAEPVNAQLLGEKLVEMGLIKL